MWITRRRDAKGQSEHLQAGDQQEEVAGAFPPLLMLHHRFPGTGDSLGRTMGVGTGPMGDVAATAPRINAVAAAWFIQFHLPASEMMRNTHPAITNPTTMCTTYGCMKPMFGMKPLVFVSGRLVYLGV
jgi:hypothetical protein